MITANSRRPHHVDTHTSRMNLNDTPSRGPLTERDFPRRRITPTRRSVVHRTWRLARMLWLQWLIHANEEWVEIHHRQGIYGTANLREVEAETEELRVKLALTVAS